MTALPPLIPYYGSKHRLAIDYPRPRYDTIIEPFAGGAGYSLRYSDRKVILIERDARTAEVWRYLIGATAADIMALPVLGADDRLDAFGLAEPSRMLVSWWLGPGSGGGPCNNKLQSWARSLLPNIPPQFWGERCRARIAGSVERIDHWKITEGDYRDAPDIEATWYIDPPYQDKGYRYKHGANDIDFDALGEWCKSRRGQVIVCENEGATWLPFRYHRTQHGAAADGGTRKKSIEVIWTNDPPQQAAMFDQQWFAGKQS